MSENTIKARIPGTFYHQAGPDSDPYVKIGAHVSAGDTVGLIEVMKMFHEVQAEESGTVAEFLVGNGDAVTHGQSLVKLDPD
ncbi:MAG: acetyl-CoA carboxylase [Halothiobacillus sp.]|nr:acetyl-CoA carboxylase [Halothiobacillus sp.]